MGDSYHLVSKFWREIPQRYNLIGTKCGECKTVYFPPRNVCPKCRRSSIGKIKPFKLSGKGKIYTYTVVHVAPKAFEDEVPYIIAIVKLEEGPFITSQIVDCKPEEVKINMPVEVTFRKIQEDGYTGAIYYGYKFKPIKK
jgi:hypothetical protein